MSGPAPALQGKGAAWHWFVGTLPPRYACVGGVGCRMVGGESSSIAAPAVAAAAWAHLPAQKAHALPHTHLGTRPGSALLPLGQCNCQAGSLRQPAMLACLNTNSLAASLTRHAQQPLLLVFDRGLDLILKEPRLHNSSPAATADLNTLLSALECSACRHAVAPAHQQAAKVAIGACLLVSQPAS